MINIIQNGEVYQISFRYDPSIVALIKNVPGKQWHPSSKIWTIPKDRLGWFLNEIKGTVYESQVSIRSDEDINVNATIDPTGVIPDVDISDIQMYVKEGAEVYPHQLDFMKYAIDRERSGRRSGFILADEQGAGKTMEVMNLAMYYKSELKFNHCLIICCINTSKYNWYEDIFAHTRGLEEPYILGTRFKRDKVTRKYNTGTKEKLEDLVTGHMYGDVNQPELPYFIIMNIEAMRGSVNRKYVVVDQLIQLINAGYINMVAIDEIHKNASAKSTQGKQLLRLKTATQRKVRWVPMTGTPINNRPTDVFLPLKLVDGHTFSSYYSWCNEFCIHGGFGGHEIIGYKNIPRLKSMLQSNMIRRLKKDILKHLPPKIFYTEYVENTPYQAKLYEEVSSELLDERYEIVESLNPLARLLRLRQVNGAPELIDPGCKIDSTYLSRNAKLVRLMELLEAAHDRGEKTLVFSNWVEPLRTLYRFVSKKYKTCCYTGTMSESDRELHKQTFMTNPEYTVMVGTIGAMGTSHTLTAANNVIFYDEPWTPGDRDQAIDRTHRPGAVKDSVNIFTILSRDTVDDRVHNILYTKEGVSKYVVDNSLDVRKNPELLDLLLGDTKSRK